VNLLKPSGYFTRFKIKKFNMVLIAFKCSVHYILYTVHCTIHKHLSTNKYFVVL